MPRHSTPAFWSSATCYRSAAAATPFCRSCPPPAAAARDKSFGGRAGPAAAAASPVSAAAFCSAVASPVAVLSRTAVGVRPSSCAAATAGGIPFRAQPATAAAGSAVAASPVDSGTNGYFHTAVPPRSLRTPDEPCHITTVQAAAAAAAASASGTAAAVRPPSTGRRATCGWERLPSCCLGGVSPIRFVCCWAHPFSSACNRLSVLQKEEDVRTASRPRVRLPTLAGGLRGDETVYAAYHAFRFHSPSTKLNRLLAASRCSSVCCTSADPRLPTVGACTGETPRAVSTSRRSYVASSPLRTVLCPSSRSKIPFRYIHSIKVARVAFQPAALLERATFATAGNAASFDIFQRLKDPPDARQQDDTEAAATGKKRKPSDRVLQLVDEIMNLTLIEAADLCDLCQEKLVERSGGPTFNAAAAAGRTPFPHPAAMFAGMGMSGMMPTAVPAMGLAPPLTAAPGAGQSSGPQASPAAAQPSNSQEKKEEAKATFSIKLTGFDAAKKVAVVKEVRAITALGLKESKDLVEQAPKVLKKGVPAADAEALKKKLEAAGAHVALE